LLNLFIIFSSFWYSLLVFLYGESLQMDNLISSFPTYIPFINYLIALAKTFRTIFNKSSESRHCCLFPDLRRNVFIFFTMQTYISCGFVIYSLSMLRYYPSVSNLIRAFIIKGYWILPNAFSASIQMIIKFMSFILLGYIVFIDLQMFNHHCIPGMKCTPGWNILIMLLNSVY
jgi:hypothetical protein